MKHFIILIAALLISLPAWAEGETTDTTKTSAESTQSSTDIPTDITPELTKAYYDSCMGARDQRMSRASQDFLCSCTAEKMMETMSVEDIRSMGQENQEGRNMLNRVLLDVYAPCMSAPLAEMVSNECMLEGEMNAKGMHKIDLCHCIGEKTGAWFSGSGRDLMADVLKKNPNITDPVGPIMNSTQFKKESFANMQACLSTRGKK